MVGVALTTFSPRRTTYPQALEYWYLHDITVHALRSRDSGPLSQYRGVEKVGRSTSLQVRQNLKATRLKISLSSGCDGDEWVVQARIVDGRSLSWAKEIRQIRQMMGST
jgi:hypothetical protein